MVAETNFAIEKEVKHSRNRDYYWEAGLGISPGVRSETHIEKSRSISSFYQAKTHLKATKSIFVCNLQDVNANFQNVNDLLRGIMKGYIIVRGLCVFVENNPYMPYDSR